jgi:hypothetical protein
MPTFPCILLPRNPTAVSSRFEHSAGVAGLVPATPIFIQAEVAYWTANARDAESRHPEMRGRSQAVAGLSTATGGPTLPYGSVTQFAAQQIQI